jgi:phosphoglucomutase
MKELIEKLRKVRIAQEVSYAFDYVLYQDEINEEILECSDLSSYSVDEIKEACKDFEGSNDGDMDRQLIMICDDILIKNS